MFASSGGIPDQWPSDVPEPNGLSGVTGTYLSEGNDLSIVITGTASGDLREVFDRYTGELKNAGFVEESTFTQGDDTATSSYLRADRRLTVSAQSQGDTTRDGDHAQLSVSH